MNRTNRVQCYMYVRDLFGYGYIFFVCRYPHILSLTEKQNYTLTQVYSKSIKKLKVENPKVEP